MSDLRIPSVFEYGNGRSFKLLATKHRESMTDSAEASLKLIIEQIEGEYSNFSVSSHWGRRQLMLVDGV